MIFGFRAKSGRTRDRARRVMIRFMESLDKPKRIGEKWETTNMTKTSSTYHILLAVFVSTSLDDGFGECGLCNL